MDSSAVSTTGHQDITMDATGQCGSCPCSDAPTPPQVLKEISELKKEYPRCYSTMSVNQVQCISFIVLKPEVY